MQDSIAIALLIALGFAFKFLGEALADVAQENAGEIQKLLKRQSGRIL